MSRDRRSGGTRGYDARDTTLVTELLLSLQWIEYLRQLVSCHCQSSTTDVLTPHIMFLASGGLASSPPDLQHSDLSYDSA